MRLSQTSLNALPLRSGVVTSTFDERLGAAYELQTRVLNSDSFRNEFQAEMDSNLEALSQITGEAPKQYRLPTGRNHPNLVKRRDDYIRKTDELLAAHGLPTSEQARDNVRKRQKEILETSENTSARADGFDFAGFLGTAGGAFVDPINVTAMIATAPIAVQSLPLFVLSEMAIGGLTETGIQVALRDDLKEIGFTEEQADEYALYSIGGATVAGGAFAALFRGLGKGASAGFKRFRFKTAEDLVTRLQNGEPEAVDLLARLNEQTNLTPKEQAARDTLNRVAEVAEDVPAERRNPGTVAEYAMKLDAATDTINNTKVNVKLTVGETPEIKLPGAKTGDPIGPEKLAKMAGLNEDELSRVVDLTPTERQVLDERLSAVEAERQARKAGTEPSGKEKPDITKIDEATVEANKQAEAEKVEAIKAKITEIAQSMSESAYEKYVRGLKKASNIGKKKFADLNNVEKRAVRIVTGFNISKKYDALPKADKDAINIEARTVYDALLKIRSENRLPTDNQIRKEFVQQLLEERQKGILAPLDAEQIKAGIENRGGYLNDLSKSLEDAYEVTGTTVGHALKDINEQTAPDLFRLRNSEIPEELAEQVNDALGQPEGRSLEDIQANARDGVALIDNELVEAQMRLEIEKADPDFLSIAMKQVDENGTSTTKTVQEIIDEMDAEESAVEKIVACAT